MSDDDRREQIAAAALEVFGRYGHRRTSMDLLAQAAGMSRPALYQYFRNKDEVFRAVGELVLARVAAQALLAGGPGPALPQRLVAALSVKLDLVSGSLAAEYRAQLFAEALEIVPDVVREGERRYAAVVETILLDAIADADLLDPPAADVAAVLVESLTGIAASRHPVEVQRRRLRQLVELTVRGFTTRPRQE